VPCSPSLWWAWALCIWIQLRSTSGSIDRQLALKLKARRIAERKAAEEAQAAQAPAFEPHGPFMTAADPDGTIVNSDKPLVLVPKGYTANAQVQLEAICPQPDPQADADLCQATFEQRWLPE
jgi:hypothetical protein